jgi:probable rRNA maturation factor
MAMVRTKPPAAELYIEAPAWRAAEPAIDVLARAAAELALEGAHGSVSILLADDAFVQGLNRRHRGLDKPTNVLSFPAPAAFEERLGDVVLGFETVSAEAAARGISLADHTRHLVVHGILHLLGHDHQDAAEAAGMEALEAEVLARLGIADPYTLRD